MSRDAIEQLDWPVDMASAAYLLRMSRRTLTSLIGRHPHYVQGGKKKVFYEQDIAALGKGEVVGSIPPGSTSFPSKSNVYRNPDTPIRAIARRTKHEHAAVFGTFESQRRSLMVRGLYPRQEHHEIRKSTACAVPLSGNALPGFVGNFPYCPTKRQDERP